ncbi:hypothetical protein BCD67_19455 [Oscillatoriales cyanobacterium USR001]|nr:hypothetical protein BCD67_19455 [Oscillatoriales cyanobacterium USR001]
MTSQIKKIKFGEPLDRIAIIMMLLLSVLIALLLVFGGDSKAAKVRDFSWQEKQIGAEDTGFILTFNRPMNHASVEKNLRIDPPLPGKFSWAGRRMAYTLIEPIPYGTTYSIQLQGATDKFHEETTQTASSETPIKKQGGLIQPFTGFFRSRDRAFAYIGIKGEEQGRLMLVNLTTEPKPIALTPKDLVVMDFKPYPKGNKILFSATDRSNFSNFGTSLEQELYTVTTGIHPRSPGEEIPKPEPVGRIDKILDSKEYQNLKFDLSADGKIIVVQRVNRRNPTGDNNPWILVEGEKPRRLENQQGGDFLIRPDNKSMVISQKQGLAIVPLKAEADPVEFLPKFAQVLSLAPDNSAAAYVKYNTDYTRSLFVLTNQGEEQEIVRIPGSILSVQFDPRTLKNQRVMRIYCLLTERLKTEEYKEQPFIAAIDLIKEKGNLIGTIKPLLILPNQIDTQMSLSPDGLVLIFDQSVTATNSTKADTPRTKGGEAIATSRLWLLPLIDIPADGSQAKLQPEELPFAGFHPRWLP